MMWTEGQGSEPYGESRVLPVSRDERAKAVNREPVEKVGIWVQGVDRLGAAYEGIWRVIKRFLISSEGSGTHFTFVAPARFRDEIEEFLSDLPLHLRRNVDIKPFGRAKDAHDDYEAVRQSSFANQIDVDGWLVPNPMWSAARHLVKPKLVWFHDFLLVEFPQSYPRKLFLEFQGSVRDLADAGAYFVFTSPYVKEKHGQEFCGIPAEQSTLILNPPIDGLTALDGLPDDPRAAGDLIRSELRENLREWCTPAHAELFFHHISSYPYESVPYYFVSSQNREHKGFLRLAQAHASLLRERYSPYSLFTTALVDVAGMSPLEKFLKAELLMGDFLSVGKVGDATHALLYKFARMTIHPSTFEGNLPLPFAESVSLGTPCIMPYSRAYADYLDRSMHPWVFYNPTHAGIIEKVEEVEQRRQDFLEAQKEVLKHLRRHTLKDFFTLHLKAFDQSRQVRPRAAEYFVGTTRHGKPVPQSNLLKTLFTTSSNEPAAVTHSMTQARLWERFELESGSSEDAADSSALHWAAYLGGAHSKGDSYFLLGVEKDAKSPDPESLGLFAEIGSWIDDEYHVADSRAFRFDGLEALPEELIEAAGRMGVMSALGTGSVGWTKLAWSRGIVPEIRIGGKVLDGKSDVKARLVCLTRVHDPSKPARSSDERLDVRLV